MPKIHEMLESKFLKKEDAGDGMLVTIRGVDRQNVGKDDEPELKWVALFEECKPMVLNGTNLALIEKALGSDDTDDWVGQKIVLFNDENVSFGGKVVGGIRVDVNRTKRYHAKNAPQKREQPDPALKGSKFDDFQGDVPF